jgi:hypothetical protein
MIDLFKDIGLEPKKLHSKFTLLNRPMLAAERKIVASWVEGFIDRDNKIVQEFQTTFHSAFWELYLHRFFQELDFIIDYSHQRPDFLVTSPEKFYVEAVTANIKKGGRKEGNLDDILDHLIAPHLQTDFEEQMTEAIIRYSNAIQSKVAKMKREYSNLSWVDPNAPFVIAMASFSQVNYGREYYYPMFALLYGLFYDPKTKAYLPKEEILKAGSNAPIKVSLFDDPAMQEVSAIIFSCTVTLGKLTALAKSASNSQSTQTVLIIREEYEAPHYWFQEVSEDSPELHSDGLFIFHNPNARVKLSPNTFSGCCALQIILDEDGIQFIGSREPMLIRLNIPSIWLPPDVKKFVIEGTFQAFNNIRLPGY